MKRKHLALIFSVFLFSNSFSQILLQESFDGTTFAPAGWYNTRMAPSFSTSQYLWDRVTDGTSPNVTPHSGAGMARFNTLVTTNDTETELGTSALNFSGTSRYRVRFWMYRSDVVNAFDQLDIYVSISQSAAFGSRIGSVAVNTNRTPAEAANGWYEYAFDVPATFNYSSVYVIFRAVSKRGLPIYIDDVVVETISCIKPQLPAATSNSTTLASLKWTAPATGTPSGYEWEIRTAGSAGTGTTGLIQSGSTGAETTVNVTGLTAGTNYKLYVRSVCGTDKSTWTDASSFKTQCVASTIPYFENFDGNLAQTNTCTNVENINGGYGWTITSFAGSGSIAQSSPYAAVCQFGGTTNLPQDDWFFSAPLQLEAGKCYETYFSYRSLYTNYPTSFEVKMGASPSAAAMTSPVIYNNLSFIDVNYKNATGTFTVAQNGIYFIGFHHTGSDGGSVIIDDFGVRENIGVPKSITVNTSVNSATLNWNAPDCGTASDYEWELRSSGSAGSGSTGLLSSGSGNVLTTTFNGLSEGTYYSFYIRSKNGTLASAWSNALVFITNCNIRTLPYTENFDGVTAPAKPGCILTANPAGGNPWVNVANSLAHSAPNCMRIQYNTPTTVQLDGWFFTPPFNFTAGKSYRLTFWYRAHIVYSTEKLEVKYGQGATASAMTSTPLFYNTALTTSFYQQHIVDFVPSTNGLYNIGFHGFSGPGGSDYIRVDDITVSETPICDSVRSVKAKDIAATSAKISWSLPLSGSAAGYKWELRTSGTAGSGDAGLINSGNLASGATDVILNSLTTSTPYQFYIQSTCGGQSGDWVLYNFNTACTPVTLPYTENFDGVTPPQFPACFTEEDKVDDAKWLIYNNNLYARSAPNSMWHNFNPWSPVDDWFYSAPLQLVAGQSYRLDFYYSTIYNSYYEALEVKLGNFAQSSSMTGTPLYSATNLRSAAYQLISINFTAPANGVYYLGFHSFSSYSQGGIYLDDISVSANTATALNENVNGPDAFIKQFYPNPVKDELIIVMNPEKDNGSMNITVNDISGKRVKTVIMQLTGSGKYTLNMKGLAGGLYTIEAFHKKSGKRIVNKVVKR